MAQPGSFLHYFIGPMNAETRAIMEELKIIGEFCISTDIHEEIEQGVNQVGKVILIFSDIKFILEFIKKLNTSDTNLRMFLVIDQNGTFKPPVMELLLKSNITFRTPKDRATLYKEIQLFFDGEPASPDVIEFSANTKD